MLAHCGAAALAPVFKRGQGCGSVSNSTESGKEKKAGDSMANKGDYIAVFDSGVGGISVLRRLKAIMPHERYLYYGDSANAPYGTRLVAQVQQFALNVAEKLRAEGIKALVVACNTATAAAIGVLRGTYPDMIIVGIEPAVKLAADLYPGSTVGVLATPVTLHEEKFITLAERYARVCNIIPLPAPGLADLVEEGKGNSEEARALLRPLLAPWAGKLDALVLGCTHYPFARQTIQSLVGAETVMLDGGEGTARETRRQLEKAGLLHEGPGEIVIRSSSSDSRMLQRCWDLLNQK